MTNMCYSPVVNALPITFEHVASGLSNR